MKIIGLNSEVDNFIVAIIVGLIALFFLFLWLKEKNKNKRLRTSLFNNDEVYLENYTLNFDKNVFSNETQALKVKIISILVSIIIIVTPLYEVIVTLKSKEIFYSFSCLP